MSTNHTANYQLNLWESGDDFLRTDFNADHTAIDAAIAGKTEVVVGSYAGSGAATRTITLGFAPKALLFDRSDGARGNGSPVGGIVQPGKPLSDSVTQTITLTETGFLAQQAVANYSGKNYYYLAFR